MTDPDPKKELGFFVALGHVFRWLLEAYFVWGLVLPETGPWTCFVLTCMTVGIEANFFNTKWIKEALVQLADDMMKIYKK